MPPLAARQLPTAAPPLHAQVVAELSGLGVAADAIEGILQALALKDVQGLEALLGADTPAVADLRRLFDLAAAYGYADWLVFDASVVRGLAYYTGERKVWDGRCAGVGWGRGACRRPVVVLLVWPARLPAGTPSTPPPPPPTTTTTTRRGVRGL